MKTRVLAFSSSREGNGEYLETAAPMIQEFLGDKELKIAFVPFALVDPDHEAYTQKVRDGLAGMPYKYQTVSLSNAKSVFENADVIMVGGGNTFKLLHDLYAGELIWLIKEKVQAGIPFIGWSAGSNICGTSICTSNDMPIINPGSFKALEFFPFQINPHYYNQPIVGFNGETRDQRLAEFLHMNPLVRVVALPEGTTLLLEDKTLKLLGTTNAALFQFQQNIVTKQELRTDDDLSFLL